jgi:hypothetical protein
VTNGSVIQRASIIALDPKAQQGGKSDPAASGGARFPAAAIATPHRPLPMHAM